MSEAIRFLEMAACEVRGNSMQQYVQEIAKLRMDPVQKDALIARDSAALAAELNGRGGMCCMIMDVIPDGDVIERHPRIR